MNTNMQKGRPTKDGVGYSGNGTVLADEPVYLKQTRYDDLETPVNAETFIHAVKKSEQLYRNV